MKQESSKSYTNEKYDSIEEIESFIDNLPSYSSEKPLQKITINKITTFHNPKKQDNRKKFSIFTNKNNKKISNIQIFGIIISLVVISSFLILVIFPIFNGSLHMLIVLSGSMSPAFNSGDILLSEKINPDEIKINDIITFVDSSGKGNIISHRVANISTATDSSGSIVYSFETKGDANNKKDTGDISSIQIIGKVVYIIPFIGYIPYFMSTFYGFLVLIIIPGCLIIINEIWKINKNMKNDKNQNIKKYRIRIRKRKVIRTRN